MNYRWPWELGWGEMLTGVMRSCLIRLCSWEETLRKNRKLIKVDLDDRKRESIWRLTLHLWGHCFCYCCCWQTDTRSSPASEINLSSSMMLTSWWLCIVVRSRFITLSKFLLPLNLYPNMKKTTSSSFAVSSIFLKGWLNMARGNILVLLCDASPPMMSVSPTECILYNSICQFVYTWGF